METKLHVIFTGLCLFVPDPEGKAMHVLLPDAKNHVPHGVGKHFARLYYDEGYERPSGGLTRKWEKEKLDHRALAIPKLSADLDLSLPKQVVNITTTVGGTVAKSQLKQNPANVMARVTLRSGKITLCRPGCYWDLDGKEVCMTNFVVWTMGMDTAGPIELELMKNANAGTGKDVDKLYLKNGELVLYVFNVTKPDLPLNEEEEEEDHGEPGNDPPGHHFMVYYDVLTGSTNLAHPALLAEQCPPECEDPFVPAPFYEDVDLVLEKPMGVDPKRCMVAGGTLG